MLLLMLNMLLLILDALPLLLRMLPALVGKLLVSLDVVLPLKMPVGDVLQAFIPLQVRSRLLNRSKSWLFLWHLCCQPPQLQAQK